MMGGQYLEKAASVTSRLPPLLRCVGWGAGLARIAL